MDCSLEEESGEQQSLCRNHGENGNDSSAIVCRQPLRRSDDLCPHVPILSHIGQLGLVRPIQPELGQGADEGLRGLLQSDLSLQHRAHRQGHGLRRARTLREVLLGQGGGEACE